MNNSNSFNQWLTKAGHVIASLPWARMGLVTLCLFLSLVLTGLIAGTVYVENLLGQIRGPSLNINPSISDDKLPEDFDGEIIDPNDIAKPTEPLTVISHKDLVNIMLVGQDRREGEHYLTRSDAMILCTINKQNNTITLSSFMRDLYVSIPNHGGNKLNAAYERGGMPLLRSTMLQNFGIQVDGFIEVDFAGFTKVIDILGGVNIHLTQEEADHLNENNGYHLTAGMNHLNGDQALQYSRIRTIGNDFGRTERQRKVIDTIISGCKKASFATLNNILNNVLPYIATDLSDSQIFNYAMELFPVLSNSTIRQQRIPIEGTFYDTGPNAVGTIPYCLVPDYKLNHQFLMETLLPK